MMKFIFLGLLSTFPLYSFAQIGAVLSQVNIDPATEPTGLAYDGSHLWYVDDANDKIHRLDPVNQNIVATIDAPDRCTPGLAWDGSHLWCLGSRAKKAFKLSAQGEVLRSVDVSPMPRGIAFRDGKLWYADSALKMIFCLDTTSLVVTDTIPAAGNYCRGIVWHGNDLWSADANLNELYRMDHGHKMIYMILPFPGSSPYGLTFDGEALWALDADNGMIYRISIQGNNPWLVTDSITAHIQLSQQVKNVGATSMILKTWFCHPEPSPRQKFHTEVQYYPAPNTIVRDQYGSPYAYWVDPVTAGDSNLYTMDVDVTTYDLRYLIDPDQVGGPDQIPVDIQQSYLSNGEYYDINNPIIVNAVREAIGEETNPYWKARKIHNYIIQRVSYVLDGRWDHAPQVLDQGHGSCSEYSILFAAMCRAAGIPARYEAGSYYGGSMPWIDQVYHRWNQIYLPPYGWIHVDVTWDDRDIPANQSRYFGATSKLVFATTLSGGGSDILDWGYNATFNQSGGIRERTVKFTWSNYVPSGMMPLHEPANNILLQNYPNPFHDYTLIEYSVNKAGPVFIRIMDAAGRHIRTINEGHRSPGVYTHHLNRDHLDIGTYIYQVISADGKATSSLVVF